MAVLIGALFFLLIFLGFDLATSPAWQVGIYHGMLALLLSHDLCSGVSTTGWILSLGERFRMVMLVLAVLTPVVVFFTGWILIGPYSGFRDDRIFDLVVVSVSGFMLIWMFITFPLCGFVCVRELVRLRRRGVPRNDGSS